MKAPKVYQHITVGFGFPYQRVYCTFILIFLVPGQNSEIIVRIVIPKTYALASTIILAYMLDCVSPSGSTGSTWQQATSSLAAYGCLQHDPRWWGRFSLLHQTARKMVSGTKTDDRTYIILMTKSYFAIKTQSRVCKVCVFTSHGWRWSSRWY